MLSYLTKKKERNLEDVHTCSDTTIVLEWVWRCLLFWPFLDRTTSWSWAICLFRLLMSWAKKKKIQTHLKCRTFKRVAMHVQYDLKYLYLFHNIRQLINLCCFIIEEGFPFGHCDQKKRMSQILTQNKNLDLDKWLDLLSWHLHTVSFSNFAKVLVRSLPILLKKKNHRSDLKNVGKAN